jgi:transcriptional regulator with XRE-family HTH domain
MSKIDNLISNALSQMHYKRKKMKLSQEDLALKVGCTIGAISNIETLKAKPSLDLLKKICEELEIEI